MSKENKTEQRTYDWHRQRLGIITGSQVGKLFVKGRGKDEYFGKTALDYINRLIGERLLDPQVVENDIVFADYIDKEDVTTSAMRWGIDYEDEARYRYELATLNKVEAVGSIPAKIEGFASSPDGLVESEDEKGCVEIKCPGIATFVKYLDVTDNDSLLKTEPMYFYQCQSHMLVLDAQWCDFVVYYPFLANPIHIVRITRDDEVIGQIEERVSKAIELIELKLNNYAKRD